MTPAPERWRSEPRRSGVLAVAFFLLASQAQAGLCDGVSSLPGQADREVHTRSAPPWAEPAEGENPTVDLAMVYTFDLWRTARGGLRRDWRYLDNLDVTVTVDAERALGWHGATLFAYGLYNNGNSLSDDLVGDLQTVSNIDSGSQALRLYEAWIEQRFASDSASLKVGLYDLNSEFDTNDSNSLFINSSHGIGPDFSQSGQNGPSIFPVTSLALRADYRFSDHWLVRAAILDGVPGEPSRPKRTTVKLGNGDGALLVAELEYSDEVTKAAIGAWRYTARFEDVLASHVAGRTVTRGGNGGAYLFLERKLAGSRKDGPGLAAWARIGFADDDLNPSKGYLGGGLVRTGTLPGRDKDRIGLAVASVKLGDPYRRALELTGENTDARETNLELTYRTTLLPWLTVQPDVQYVVNPGARPDVEDAVVIGVRVEVGF